MTLRILLVDDEALARARLRRMLQSHADVECVGEASHGLEALQRVEELAPDLLLLDVQMPELDGLAVAAALPQPGPKVVFVTAYESHALRAFELAAVDYLLKPVNKDRLAVALARVRNDARSPREQARAIIQQQPTPLRRMAVRSGSKYIVFDVDRIAAVLASDHYSILLVDGQELLSDESLDKLILRLDDTQFMRVHRSAIVNLKFLQELQQEGDRKYVARLSSAPEARVPISRDKLDELRERLGIALRG